MRFLRASIFTLTLALLPVLPAVGQTTFATITGIVNDSAGAVVPGATVEATHVKSNYKYNTQTNHVGAYTLSQLREGEYTLRVGLPGFKEFVVQNLQLVANDLRRIDMRLEVGRRRDDDRGVGRSDPDRNRNRAHQRCQRLLRPQRTAAEHAGTLDTS